MLSERDAFKVGFLARCVEEGLTLQQAHCRVKEARDKLAGLLDLPGKALELAKPVVGAIAGYGLPGLLAAPPIVGGLVGLTAAKMNDIDDTDVAEIRQRELTDEYARQTRNVLRNKAIRDYRKQQHTNQIFL